MSFLKILLLSLFTLANNENHHHNENVPRGVPLSRSSLYDPSKPNFSCLDGSKLIPYSQVNDDYCDCSDGSDEPGTSACSRGSFYCLNAGYLPEWIGSGRVDDGVCDCCDGSDEKTSASSPSTSTLRVDVEGEECPNTCLTLGAQLREESERQAKLLKEGYSKRLEMEKEGKEFRSQKDEERVKLEAERVRLEQIKEEKEKEKELEEGEERGVLERHSLLQTQHTQKLDEIENQKKEKEAQAWFELLDSNSDGFLTKNEIKTRQTFDKDRNGEVSDEEAGFFLNDEEKMGREDWLSSGFDLARPFIILENAATVVNDEASSPREQEDTVVVGTEDEERESKGSRLITGIEEEEEEDAQLSSSEEELYEPVVTEKPDDDPTTLKYSPETQAIVDRANAARNAFTDADSELRSVINKLEELNELLSVDFGEEDDRFAVLHGQCFDWEEREYVYTLCPFGKATQKPKNGGAETSLGKWGQWTEKYTEMLYDKGASCWNGPTRSARISLTCAPTTQITSVSEPSRCEYHYDMTTPAACNQLKTNHDEL